MKDDEVIKIDIDSVLRQRASRYYKFIPRYIIRWLERIVCQERLNWLLEHNRGKRDADFCRGVLNDLNVKIDVSGEENLTPDKDRRVVIVSNHPLGGLDGIALIDYVTQVYSGKIHFIVNDLLMAIKPLNEVFLPINKHGKQSRASLKAIEDAFAGNDPIIIFPAGLVSRRQKGGIIEDLTWQKMFVNKSVEYRRNIIPLKFNGENSGFFYKFAKFRTKLGLKFNIEMIYLPREVFRSENKKFHMVIGKPIAWNTLKSGKDAQSQANEIKQLVYNLK